MLQKTYPEGFAKQIGRAVTALYQYLEKQKESGTDLIWDDDVDINMVLEPKVITKKNIVFNSIRIPLAHSFRHNTANEICLITRGQDMARWKQVLLREHPVSGLTKIMSVKTFETTFREKEELTNLVEIFDLFILHPAVRYRVAPRLLAMLRGRNKSCGILPDDPKLLRLGPAVNPLNKNKYSPSYNLKPLRAKTRRFRALQMAKMIAKYRDSTFTNNDFVKQKFIKIGESGMLPVELRQNVMRVWSGICMLAHGGQENVMRASLHIEHTQIQLPFYANLEPLSSSYEVAVSTRMAPEEFVGIQFGGQRHKTADEVREELKEGKDEMFKEALVNYKRCPNLLRNLSRCPHLQHCNERESESEDETDPEDQGPYNPLNRV